MRLGPLRAASPFSRLQPNPRTEMQQRQSSSALLLARAATALPRRMTMCWPCCGRARWQRSRLAASLARALAAY